MKTKSSVALLLLLFASIFSYAQLFDKGKILLDGSISMNHSKTENANENAATTNGNLSLSIGKAIKKNTFWGGSISIGHSDIKNELVNTSPNNFLIEKYKSNNIGASVFYRKYLALGNNFYLYGQSGLGFSYGRSKSTYSNKTNYELKSYKIELGINPGISYGLSKKLLMNLSLNNLLNLSYSHNSNNTDKASSLSFGSSLSTNALSNVGVGFSLLL